MLSVASIGGLVGLGLHRTSDLIALSLFACASANDFILTVSPMFRAGRSWAVGL